MPSHTWRHHLKIARLLIVSSILILSTSCATTEADRQAKTFEFVAPNGRTAITYEPPAARGRVGPMAAAAVGDPGRSISLSDYAGQVVVLNIWGSWCPPRRDEAPGLQLVQDTTRASGVTVLGIAVRDDPDAAADFLRGRGLTYPSMFDQPGRALLALNGFPRNVVPSTLVLDRQHRVAAVFLRAVTVAELMPVVQRIAAESPSPTPGNSR